MCYAIQFASLIGFYVRAFVHESAGWTKLTSALFNLIDDDDDDNSLIIKPKYCSFYLNTYKYNDYDDNNNDNNDDIILTGNIINGHCDELCK